MQDPFDFYLVPNHEQPHFLFEQLPPTEAPELQIKPFRPAYLDSVENNRNSRDHFPLRSL